MKGPVVNIYLAILKVEMISIADWAKLFVFDSDFYQKILEKRMALLLKSVKNASIFEQRLQ